MTYDVRDKNIRGFPAALSKAIVPKPLNNPSQINKILNLYGTYDGIGRKPIVTDGSPVIDTFQVHDIICRNVLGLGAHYDETKDYDTWQASLLRTWGFKCFCQLCRAEHADGPHVRNKRRELEEQAQALLERAHPARLKRLTVVKARRLANSISETYDEERYKNLPQTALESIQQYLAAAKDW
ncbi:hypothetical protein LTR66_009173 [Elasticomyces elasticus]|nr:hypothetical protein LTR66_009173 [Elasticomyces elasticus]KAK5008507.1 hypothetical protein LTR28_003887 [Elasticomyces elasticus]